ATCAAAPEPWANPMNPLETEVARRPHSPAGVERRAFPRRPCPPGLQGQVRLPGQAGAEAVWAVNLSQGGVALLLRQRLEPGSAVVILLGGRALPARVAHATEQAPGDWLTGCAFAHPLAPGTLAALLSKAPGPGL